MKSWIISTTALLTALISTQYLQQDFKQEKIPIEIIELYNSWKLKQGKLLSTPSEQDYRLGVFYENYLYITKVNNRQNSYKLGLNKFADMTTEEITAKYTGFYPQKFPGNERRRFKQSSKIRREIKDSIDWRKEGAVGPVKNQKTCGDCWAFSAISVMESAHYLKYKESVVLSEQQLNDCSWTEDNHGCKGGLAVLAFKYVIKNGVTSEAQYPYKAQDEKCYYLPNKMKVTTLTDYTQLVGDEQSVLEAIQEMPVSSGIFAGPITKYESGIFDNFEECPAAGVNHAIVIVGYGSEDGKDYWIVRNSWGPDWGEAGYIRFARKESGPGICGVVKWPSIVQIA